jgi:predicted nucleic acid-binding Zn ribbon protein
MKFKECEICGAYLDPGERCTCREEAAEQKRKEEAQKQAEVLTKLIGLGKRKKP